MMKLNLLFGFVIFGQTLFAQPFTESNSTTFVGIATGSIAFSDVNGNGSQDVVITGDSPDDRIAKLYANDGLGNFSEVVDAPFDGVFQSSIAFSDVNGDGYEDIVITGRNNQNQRIAKLYTNDGMGNFTEIPDTPFVGVFAGSIAFSDVNGDTYDDLLITGDNSSALRITKLYINDGSGNFSEVLDTPFIGVAASSIAFADVNGDGSNDVLITGISNDNIGVGKLYLNDGMGNFTEMSGTPFIGVVEGSIAFSDVNSDGHEDVLISGLQSSNEVNSKLYMNDGLGNFNEMMDTPMDGVTAGEIAFSDINYDGSKDLLITGLNNANERIAKLYTNDGVGNFSEVMNTPFDGVVVSAAAFADVDNNGTNDVIIGGFNNSDMIITKLYLNEFDPLSTNDLFFDTELTTTLYPNPINSNLLNVNLIAKESSIVSVNIYDQIGQLVKSASMPANVGQQTLAIDIAQLTPGNYLLQLDDGKRNGTAKFVVQ